MKNKVEIDWDALDKAALEYRKENFAVKTSPERHPIEANAISLSVTNNGNQWTSISLLQSEIPKVIEALRKAMV